MQIKIIADYKAEMKLHTSSGGIVSENGLLRREGFPSVNTSKTFGLSGRSPPAAVNNSLFAMMRALSVRVP